MPGHEVFRIRESFETLIPDERIRNVNQTKSDNLVVNQIITVFMFSCKMLSHIDDKFHDDLRYYWQFSILWLKFVQKARWFHETEARTVYVERSLCKMNESMVHVFALKSKNFRWLYRHGYHLACFFKSFLYYELLVHKTLF